MSTQNFENPQTLDQVLGEIRDEPIDAAAVEAAAGRVWSNICGARGPRLVEKIRSCADFQALMDDYRAGRLTEARRLLLEDHTHECVACRKALHGDSQAVRPITLKPAGMPYARWAVAAAVVVGVGITTLGVVYYVNGPSGSRATVAVVNGTLYRLSGAASVAVKAGDILPGGAEIRTAKDSGATIKLSDGSLVEMRERSGFSVSQAGADVTVNLGLGSIIVQAAKRHSGHLFVATRDCKVAVTGTIFSVNSGVKGSRVTVVEGEVHVTKDNDEKVLHRGDQFASSRSLAPVSPQDEISWSHDFARFKALLELQKSLESVHLPELRYSSRLIDLAPAGTAIYASIPNLGPTLVEAQQIIRMNLAQNPALASWWMGLAAHGFKPDAIISKIAEFSDYVGAEIVLAAPMDASGRLGSPLILAELKRPGFGEFIQGELKKAGQGYNALHIIEDPAQATTAPGVWMLVRPDLLAITPDGSALRFGDGAFAKTAFGARVTDAYRNGIGILFSADLERIAKNMPADMPPGVDSIRSVMVEQKETGGHSDMRMSVGFAGQRQGVFSWLAAPAPMRALDFISPEAGFVAAFTMKSPAQAMNDLQERDGLFSQDLIDSLKAVGIDIKADLAAPLGGEFALAFDGPLMPPAWKLAVEVYDAPRLQNTIERLVEIHNRTCAGKESCTAAITHESASGREYHGLKIPDVPFGDAQYTFVDGYLLAAPSRVLLDRAIQYRASGHTLTRAQQFMAMVPRDHYSNFSAMVYQNLGQQLAPVAGLLGGMKMLSPEQSKAVGDMASQMKPMLLTAYGEEDRITVASNNNLLKVSIDNLIHGNLLAMTEGVMGLPGFAAKGTRQNQPAYR
jgi:ferric-dicitrate binding protein FerR (iron transport regulator)